MSIAAIFDMDGTLVRENKYWDIMNEVVFEVSNEKIPFSYIQEFKNNGVTSDWDICYNFLKERGPVNYDSVKDKFQKKVPLFSAREELMIEEELTANVLSALGKKCALKIATTRTRKEAFDGLNNTMLSKFFKKADVYTLDDLKKFTKPLKVEMLQIIKSANGFSQGFLVGDTVSDVVSAKIAGLTAVGVYGSLDNEAALETAGADFLLKDISYLPSILNKILHL